MIVRSIRLSRSYYIVDGRMVSGIYYLSWPQANIYLQHSIKCATSAMHDRISPEYLVV